MTVTGRSRGRRDLRRPCGIAGSRAGPADAPGRGAPPSAPAPAPAGAIPVPRRSAGGQPGTRRRGTRTRVPPQRGARPHAGSVVGEIYYQPMSVTAGCTSSCRRRDGRAGEFARFWAASGRRTAPGGRAGPTMQRARSRTPACRMWEAPLILAPVCAQQAFPVGADLDPDWQARQAAIRLSVAVNLLGLPAVTVPVGRDGGLPQAVQVIGSPLPGRPVPGCRRRDRGADRAAHAGRPGSVGGRLDMISSSGRLVLS